MRRIKPNRGSLVLAASMAALIAMATGLGGEARAAPPEVREISGLREAPDIPLGSIILRRAFPDHPVPDAARERFPDLAPFPWQDLGDPGVSPAPGGGAYDGGDTCDKDIDLAGTSTIVGVVNVAALDTGLCTNSDIDVYQRDIGTVAAPDIKTYVVQAGGTERIFTLTEVTNPSNPVILSQFRWIRRAKGTYTPDVKAFRQNGNDYIAMGLERTKLTHPCGVLIWDVTDPTNPTMVSQFIGDGWCDVHNVFVENDASGNGQYIYVTADNTNDLRVLAIDAAALQGSSVTNPVEVGRYARTVRGFRGNGFFDDIYVHDVTVVGETVYASYWLAGLDVFAATLIRTPGLVGQFADENTSGVQNIKPDDFDSGLPFLVHHAFPNSDGSLVFLQDEITFDPGDEPVQMWDISNPAAPTYVDGLVLGTDVPTNPAHNLEIRYDIDATLLLVGWYKMGLQAWDFNASGFMRPGSSPRTAALYHQVQTEASDDAYSGAWGVRMEEITVAGVTNLYVFQSDRHYGLIVDCETCASAGSGVGPISDTDLTANEVAENATSGASVGITAFADDPDDGAVVTYSLTDNAGGLFAIHSGTGVITVSGTLDAETATSHSIEVEATSTDTSTSLKSFTINVTDVNEAPVGPVTDSDLGSNEVAENASVGTPVGITASAVDPDVNAVVTYSLTVSAGDRFAIDASTGVITVAATLDSDGVTQYSVTVRADSDDGTSSEAIFTIDETSAPDHDVTLNLIGSSFNNGSTWTAQVRVEVIGGSAEGALVSGTWSGGVSGPDGCTISGGVCDGEISQDRIRKRNASATFTVDSVGVLSFGGEISITVLKP